MSETRGALLACGCIFLALGLLGACQEVGKLPRCEAAREWLEQCEPGCPAPSCRADQEGEELFGLDSLDSTELGDFDACIRCLEEEALEGRCSDCQVEGRSETCRELLHRASGLDCLAP